MAHFAQLDNNNIVIQVIVVNNNELLDQDGNEVEQKGIDFCKSLFGQDTEWIQTSYNANFRKNYACGGGTYNKELDAFIAPKPYNSWILNETTCKWEAPIPKLDQDKLYIWNESTISWEELNKEI
jgi:hypothetical protein